MPFRIVMRTWAVFPLLVLSVAAAPSLPVGFDANTLNGVRNKLLQSMNASWELGVAAQAITELSWPSLSVFSQRAFPPPSMLNSTFNASEVSSIAANIVAAKPAGNLALTADSAAGDPASIGVSILLANWTRSNISDVSYSTAAGEELDYLLHQVPRTQEGAISHRADQVQLWADYVYMVPPFIAYFGVVQGGDAELPLLQTAYDQCSLYRDQLRDDGGLWKHVVLGDWQDITHWATGNAWVAAGMLRVLSTLRFSSQAPQLIGQQQNLTNWINEITSAAWQYQQANGTLLNIIDDPASFADTSGTTLLAAVTYRMAVITNDTTLIPHANRALKLAQQSINSDGWLLNTVNPYTFTTPSAAGSFSPEGQAFVLLLHAAWRDYGLFSALSGAT